MPLAGTFDVLDFGEVLTLLARRSSTGRLQVRTGSMHGLIWLAGGQATAAEIGSTSGGETKNKWRSQIEDICFDALRSPRGSFEFQPEDEVAAPAGPRVDLETLLENGRKRLQMWHEVESVIHSFEAVPRLAEALAEDSITVKPDSWRVLVAIDGRRNVAALAKRLDIELLEFCQLLKPLFQSGAVMLEHPDGWLKSLPKVRLDVGDLDPALVVDPGDPEESMAVVSVSSTVTPSGTTRNGPGPAGAGTAAAAGSSGNGGLGVHPIGRQLPPAGSTGPAAATGDQGVASPPPPGAPAAAVTLSPTGPAAATPPKAAVTAHETGTSDSREGDRNANEAGPAAPAVDPAAPTGGSEGKPNAPRRRLRGRGRARPADSDRDG